MQDLRLGANQDQRLSFLNGRMASFLAGKKSKMPPFRLSNLILKGWGNLHGQTVKSANSRTLAPWFAELAEEFLGDSPEHKSIKKLTATLRDIYALIYSAVFFVGRGEDASPRSDNKVRHPLPVCQRVRQQQQSAPFPYYPQAAPHATSPRAERFDKLPIHPELLRGGNDGSVAASLERYFARAERRDCAAQGVDALRAGCAAEVFLFLLHLAQAKPRSSHIVKMHVGLFQGTECIDC